MLKKYLIAQMMLKIIFLCSIKTIGVYMPATLKYFVLITGFIFSTPLCAASIYTSYDMRTMLNTPHPFLSKKQSTPFLGGANNEIYQNKLKLTQPFKIKKTVIPKPNSQKPIVIQKAKEKTTSETLSDNYMGTQQWDFISKLSGGLLWHDQGPFSRQKESGADLHIEVRFVSPEFLDLIWSPSPHVGANINSNGDTSQFFTGVSYEWDFWSTWFAGFSLGAAVHTGNKSEDDPDRKDLGCRLLFRESIDIGYHLNDHHDISIMLDHISNAKICSTNEGLENLGIRYSYRF